MATFKEALTTSLTNFAKSIAKTYPKTANIVDNLLSTDSTLPLSAKQGNVLQKQIDTLNSNIDILQGKRKAKLYSTNSSATTTFELADNISYLLAITYAGMGTKYSALYYVDSGGYATVFEGSDISNICTINIENKVLTITGKVYNFTSSLISLT